MESSEERWVGVSEGRGQWATAAVEVLTEVAGHYSAVVTQASLAEQVQERTGLRTRSPWRNWIGGVLSQAFAQSRAAGLPPLTSLVAMRADGGDPDEGTIRARFACYQRFADDIPAEVVAELEEQARAAAAAAEEAKRPRASRARATTRTPGAPRAARVAKPAKAPAVGEPPPAICPTCFMQLPSSGVCQNCA